MVAQLLQAGLPSTEMKQSKAHIICKYIKDGLLRTINDFVFMYFTAGAFLGKILNPELKNPEILAPKYPANDWLKRN